MVPPRHYCVVMNPVARDDDKQVLFDTSGQAKLRHADLEIRLTQDPFPLYPGEEIQQVCKKLDCPPQGWSLMWLTSRTVHIELKPLKEDKLGTFSQFQVRSILVCLTLCFCVRT